MASSLCKTSVSRIYQEVIDDVISNVREQFLEDGVDEQVLQELKQLWESKLMATKAVQGENDEKSKKTNTPVATNGFPKPQPAAIAPNQQPQPIQPGQSGTSTASSNAAAAVSSNGGGIGGEDKRVPIQLTLPPQPGTDGAQRVLTIQVPASALQGDQLRKVLTGPIITATMSLPPTIASSLLQQHVNAAFCSKQQASGSTSRNVSQTDGATAADDDNEQIEIEFILPKRFRKGKSKSKVPKKMLKQTDGMRDTSDEDDAVSDDDNDDEELDDEKDEVDAELEDEGDEEEPLNSGDDVSDEDPSDLFDTDNIVVCQYDKIIRNRNKWKFYLKDGIMNLNGLDYVFQKATGDAEW